MVGKVKTMVGKLKKIFRTLRQIFFKNVCPFWPETVPAPLDGQSSAADMNTLIGSFTMSTETRCRRL